MLWRTNEIRGFYECILTGFGGWGAYNHTRAKWLIHLYMWGGGGGLQVAVYGYRTTLSILCYFVLNNKSHTHAIIRSSSPSSPQKEVFAHWQNQILHKCEKGDW